ncbi:MAG: hypothetical protein ACE5K3_02270 [bacterium]
MEKVDHAKSLTRGIREILDPYEKRVESIGTLMRQAIEVIKSFQRQQEEKASELRNTLAKTECLRKKDFDRMMEEMWGQRRKKEKEIHDTLERFLREEKEIIDELRKKLVDAAKPMKIDDFMVLKECILNRQREREKKISAILKSFHLEQEELSIALRKLLSRGERVKIKDLKDMIRGLRAHRIYKESSIGKVLQELEAVDREVDTAWEMVMMSVQNERI